MATKKKNHQNALFPADNAFIKMENMIAFIRFCVPRDFVLFSFHLGWGGFFLFVVSLFVFLGAAAVGAAPGPHKPPVQAHFVPFD